MTQKFKNNLYTMPQVVSNILSIYDQSEGGSNWYNEAHEFARTLANKYILKSNQVRRSQNIFREQQLALAKVAGIIASLSPLKTWGENKIITEWFLKTGKAKHITLFEQKAEAILESDGEIETISEILNGNKITSFFLNIFNPHDATAVTVDRHAVSIAVGEVLTGDTISMTSNQYEFLSNAYRIASLKRKVRPSQMQSVTWVKWREMKKEVKQTEDDDLPF